MNVNKKIGRPRLLLFGCGDIGMRLISLIHKRFRIIAITRNIKRCDELRMIGATPIVADLDQISTLIRLTSLAQMVIHLVPPQSVGEKDYRTRNLIKILSKKITLIYVSTTGVYGNCDGAIFDETRKVKPQNKRAKRRVDAEQILRIWARRSKSRLAILRVPSIYADNRLPVIRLQKNIPVLVEIEDIYTNHIHAQDLVMIIFIALYRSRPLRIYHAVDNSQIKMGDYLDNVAQALNIVKPPRLTFKMLQKQVSSKRISFMLESRRLSNDRLHNELCVRLRYPYVLQVLSMFKNNTKL